MNEGQALALVGNYIDDHGYKAIRFDTSTLPQGVKAPDFEVHDNNKIEFWCEVKTPELTPNPDTGMYHWTTTASKLRSFIHKAVKQFRDQDPKHDLPWVIFFTSAHFQLNWTNLTHCIQGAVAFNGQVLKDLGGLRFVQETDADIKEIDLFVWCQVNSEQLRIYQMVHFGNQESQLLNKVTEISDKLTPRPNEGIKGRNP